MSTPFWQDRRLEKDVSFTEADVPVLPSDWYERFLTRSVSVTFEASHPSELLLDILGNRCTICHKSDCRVGIQREPISKTKWEEAIHGC